MGTPLCTARTQAYTRDYRAERQVADQRLKERVVELAAARYDQTLGEEYIKLAQALILCTLPYSPTPETRIVRRARTGDGSFLTVTFVAVSEGILMPYGADRKLLHWLIDRAIRADDPYVPWSSALEYQREMGIRQSGRSTRQIRERFARIAGLVIQIKRNNAEVTAQNTFPIIEASYLPNSLSQGGSDQQRQLPSLGDRFGVILHRPLFEDLKRHKAVLPRRLWLEIDGPTAVQDLVLWLSYRCYSAASETVIPWVALQEQFPTDDTNPHRIRQHARRAVTTLRALWPGIRLEYLDTGILIDRAAAPMLDDDVSKNRFRRL